MKNFKCLIHISRNISNSTIRQNLRQYFSCFNETIYRIIQTKYCNSDNQTTKEAITATEATERVAMLLRCTPITMILVIHFPGFEKTIFSYRFYTHKSGNINREIFISWYWAVIFNKNEGYLQLKTHTFILPYIDTNMKLNKVTCNSYFYIDSYCWNHEYLLHLDIERSTPPLRLHIGYKIYLKQNNQWLWCELAVA